AAPQQSSVDNSLLNTSRRLDLETGLEYSRARYYDVRVDRFLQRDPWAYVNGMGLYEYVMSNPLKLVDPFGTEAAASDSPCTGDWLTDEDTRELNSDTSKNLVRHDPGF